MKRWILTHTEAMAAGLAEAGYPSDAGTDFDCAALTVAGNYTRMGERKPPALTAWQEAVSVDRLAAVARSLRADLASLVVPVAPGPLVDERAWPAYMRDVIESGLVGLHRAGCTRAEALAHPDLIALRADLAAFDKALAKVATRADVARALGDRAPLIRKGWWGERIPRALPER